MRLQGIVVVVLMKTNNEYNYHDSLQVSLTEVIDH